MKRFKTFYNSMMFVLCSITLLGCSSSRIDRPSISPEVFNLAALNQRSIGLEVRSLVDPERRVGSQFLLFAVPFGGVYLPDPYNYILRAAYEKLSLAGYKPITGPYDNSSPSPRYRLRLTFSDVSASGFDFLFLRNISCSVDITGELLTKRGLKVAYWRSRKSKSGVRRYAFSRDIAPLLEDATDKALSEIFANLKL